MGCDSLRACTQYQWYSPRDRTEKETKRGGARGQGPRLENAFLAWQSLQSTVPAPCRVAQGDGLSSHPFPSNTHSPTFLGPQGDHEVKGRGILPAVQQANGHVVELPAVLRKENRPQAVRSGL